MNVHQTRQLLPLISPSPSARTPRCFCPQLAGSWLPLQIRHSSANCTAQTRCSSEAKNEFEQFAQTLQIPAAARLRCNQNQRKWYDSLRAQTQVRSGRVLPRLRAGGQSNRIARRCFLPWVAGAVGCTYGRGGTRHAQRRGRCRSRNRPGFYLRAAQGGTLAQESSIVG